MFKRLLRARLLASPDVSYTVGARVYPVGEIPQSPTVPYIYYSEDGVEDDVHDTQGRGGLIESVIQVVGVTETFTESQVLGADMKTALNKYRGTGEGETIAGIFLQDAHDESVPQADEAESPLHLAVQEYAIWHRE